MRLILNTTLGHGSICDHTGIHPRLKLKLNRVESIDRNSKIYSGVRSHIFYLIEQSLKQIDEYCFKIENNLNKSLN